jgi:hypothetical protein
MFREVLARLLNIACAGKTAAGLPGRSANTTRMPDRRQKTVPGWS